MDDSIHSKIAVPDDSLKKSPEAHETVSPLNLKTPKFEKPLDYHLETFPAAIKQELDSPVSIADPLSTTNFKTKIENVSIANDRNDSDIDNQNALPQPEESLWQQAFQSAFVSTNTTRPEMSVKPTTVSKEIISLLSDEGAAKIHRELQENPEKRRTIKPTNHYYYCTTLPRRNVRSCDGQRIRQTELDEGRTNGDKNDSSVPRIRLKSMLDSSSDQRRSVSSGLATDDAFNRTPDQTFTANSSIIDEIRRNCKEIRLQSENQFLHIILCPTTSKLKNSFNEKILQELILVFKILKVQAEIKVVLITSAGPAFCAGIDLPSLLHINLTCRMEAAIFTSKLIQDFILEIANCDQILVGGVSGSVIGLGVSILPYLDLVLASSESIYYLPYFKLDQTSEGGLSFTLNTLMTEIRSLNKWLAYEDRLMTATEALQKGLVHEVLPHRTFGEDLILRVKEFTAQIRQSSLDRKKLVRVLLRRELPTVLNMETRMLRKCWISDEFQRRACDLWKTLDFQN